MDLIIFRRQSRDSLYIFKYRCFSGSVILIDFNGIVQLKVQISKSSVRTEFYQLWTGFGESYVADERKYLLDDDDSSEGYSDSSDSSGGDTSEDSYDYDMEDEGSYDIEDGAY